MLNDHWDLAAQALFEKSKPVVAEEEIVTDDERRRAEDATLGGERRVLPRCSRYDGSSAVLRIAFPSRPAASNRPAKTAGSFTSRPSLQKALKRARLYASSTPRF